MPKLSIITINFNNAEGLKKTIESVSTQSLLGFEYIIIDGGSQDGSVDLIKKYYCIISHFVSEPDNGIFSAMNKGIALASGEYILFMNSGDWLLHDQILEEAFDYGFIEDYVFGRANLVQKGKIIESDYVASTTAPTLYDMLFQSLPHQASFIRKELLLKHGEYDESLCIMGDWAFTIKAVILNNCSIRYIPLTICNYDLSGVSTVKKELAEIEKRIVLESYFPSRVLADYYSMLSYHNERIRVDWFRIHPFFYNLYLYLYKIGRKLEKKNILR